MEENMKWSQAAKELEPKLRKLWNSDDYVKGVITFAGSDDNLYKISDFIDMSYRMNQTITADDISYLILVLNKDLGKNE